MKKKLTLLVLLQLILISQATCCSCNLIPFKEAVKNSDEIFFGRVIELKNLGKIPYSFSSNDIDSMSLMSAVFEIEKKWKGENNKRIEVFQLITSCSFGFEFHENYIVYGKKDSNSKSDSIWTWLCARNASHLEYDWKYYAEDYPDMFPDYYWQKDSLLFEGFDDRPKLDSLFPHPIKLQTSEINVETTIKLQHFILSIIITSLFSYSIGRRLKNNR